MALTIGEKKGILITTSLLAITSVLLYLKKQVNYLYNATYKVIGAKVYNVGLTNIKFDLYEKIQNDGDISAIITNQNYDIYANGKLVSNVSNKTKVKLNSHGSTIIPFTIEFNPEAVLLTGINNISAILQDKSQLKFIIKVKLSLMIGVISLKDYEFDISYNLAEIIAMSTSPTTNV